MERIDECTKQLIAALKQSKEYQDYMEIRAKIKLEPEKERIIHEFSRQVFEAHAKSNREHLELFGEMDRLEQDFAAFREQPLVEEYLDAQLSVCRLVQHINWKLMQEIEFDCFWNQ